MEDEVMARVTAAVQRGQGGERSAARRELDSPWDGDGRADAFHRCVIAHLLADLQDDARDELGWDERSLPDDHRRPGDAERARGFLEQARAASDALGDDAYGDLVRGTLDRVGRALHEGSTAPLPDA